MEVRTQLGILAVMVGAWAGSTWVRVRPLLDTSTHTERMSLATLEAMVARNPSDAVSTRTMLQRYLDHGMTRLVVDTANRCPPGIQRDGVVTLLAARAQESLGNVAAANALVTGALQRCGTTARDLQDAVGCDVRTQTELAMENAALDRMSEWHISPVTDPARASVAHEIATRPVRLSPRLSDSL